MILRPKIVVILSGQPNGTAAIQQPFPIWFNAARRWKMRLSHRSTGAKMNRCWQPAWRRSVKNRVGALLEVAAFLIPAHRIQMAIGVEKRITRSGRPITAHPRVYLLSAAFRKQETYGSTLQIRRTAYRLRPTIYRAFRRHSKTENPGRTWHTQRS